VIKIEDYGSQSIPFEMDVTTITAATAFKLFLSYLNGIGYVSSAEKIDSFQLLILHELLLLLTSFLFLLLFLVAFFV
jgi:hypothetical protein